MVKVSWLIVQQFASVRADRLDIEDGRISIIKGSVLDEYAYLECSSLTWSTSLT